MEPSAVRKTTASYGVWQSESALAEDLRTRMERAGQQPLRGLVTAEPGDSSDHVMDDDSNDRPSATESAAKTSFEADSLPFWDGSSASAPDIGPRPMMEHYSSPMFLANLLIVMLALQLGYFLFAAVLTVRGTAGNLFSIHNGGVLQTGLFVTTCMAFVAWTYRLYANLSAFGTAGLKLNAGLAAAFMVIPVVNLIMPYRIFSEIWAASHPDVDSRNPSAWCGTRADTITVLWWFSITVAFTISQVFGYASEALGRGFVAPPLIGHLAFAVSALLAIIVVWRLSTRQDDKQYQLCAAQAI